MSIFLVLDARDQIVAAYLSEAKALLHKGLYEGWSVQAQIVTDA